MLNCRLYVAILANKCTIVLKLSLPIESRIMADMRRDDQKRQHSGPTFEQARANAIALKEGWVTDDEDGAAPAAHGGSAADVATDSDNVK